MLDISFTMTVDGATPPTASESRQATIDRVADISPEFAQSLTLAGSPQNALLDTAVMSKLDIQHALTNTINSLTPQGANEIFLNQLAYIYGLERGEYARPSVYIKFTGTVGLLIPKDFLVGDSIHQYRVVNAEIIGSNGYAIVYCIATTDGAWEIPANTVTQILSSVYNQVTLTCVNPSNGFTGAGVEKLSVYRARTIAALTATCGSTYALAKSNIQKILPDKRLVSIRQVNYATKIVVAGGDMVKIAFAIFNSGIDTSRLIGSLNTERNVSTPVIVPPNIYHILIVQGQQAVIDYQVTWNTNHNGFYSNSAIAALVKPAFVDYTNSLILGSEINILKLNEIFREAVKSVILPEYISKIKIIVKVNNVIKPAVDSIVTIDSEFYTYTSLDKIEVDRG